MAAANQEIIERAMAILSDRRPIYESMREQERQRGFKVIIPGEAPWLPAEDWHHSVIISLDGSEVRIVAVVARRSGSFRRLLGALASFGLRPVVVCPIGPIMPAIMKHLNWKRRVIGSGWDAEEEWRPRNRKPLA